ncbi:biotin--[acetyl-CoA-carboxylase] ligase [Floccifex sp.]|uniref:biotin--[acetyl-CoA-carboxylase] ligase n=1 Tax=Floccifex sp. TaxID=2815810 RepID=UPI003F09EAD6
MKETYMNKKDILSTEGIKKYLDCNCEIHYEQEVTSTNSCLVQLANTNIKEGYVLVCSSQTKGKGRTGHSFYSPSQSGVYLSVLLRPDKSPMETTNITPMAAVAACEAIEKIKDVHPQIKWINDIFVNQKKVCGILTEASINTEKKCMDYVVLGIGFNVYEPQSGFPHDLKDIAGSIFDEEIEDGKNKLVAYFINSFFHYYSNWNRKDYYQAYKDRCMILNKKVLIKENNHFKEVFAKDINENFELIIVDEGSQRIVNSGEVHINAKFIS